MTVQVEASTINKWAERIFAQNKAVGWWDDINRCPFTTIQLINTEIAEATEGERKDRMDDHLPHRKMGEVELADALIRTLDIGGRMGLTYTPLDDQDIQLAFGEQPAQLHLLLSIFAGTFAIAVRDNQKDKELPYAVDDKEEIEGFYSILVHHILVAAEVLGYDISGALREKNEYNRQRSDHKRVNREAAGGKKF